MPQDKTQKTDKKNESNISDPAKTLLQIVHGDVKDVKVPHKSIITGKKLKNSVLEKFVRAYQKFKLVDDTKLIEIILQFDKSIEKEHLTDDLLKKIRKNPKLLSELKADDTAK